MIYRGLKPGQAILDKIGGAHKLQSWPHNILTGLWLTSDLFVSHSQAKTDSGGFVRLPSKLDLEELG